MTDADPPCDLVAELRESLAAKLERLLRRPVIASVVDAPAPDPEELDGDDVPDVFRALDGLVRGGAPTRGGARRANPWREDRDGTCTVRIALDYDDVWRGGEKEVLEAVVGTVEGFVTFLTDAQKRLLERSPREFLALEPAPEVAELVTFRTEMVGGAERVVELTVAEAPKSPGHVRHVAIVPNLVPLERQLAGLATIARAPLDGPLGPLRALVGLDPAEALPAPDPDVAAAPAPATEGLDPFQAECVRKALTTPHFAVIQGPPGSGKTTVISAIIRAALARGERVLVVSPTHVAVDNVVEKLTPKLGGSTPDDLAPRTLPVRFAARPKRLLPAAEAYWVGPKQQRRAATVARRVERCLSAEMPLARALYARVDPEATGTAPLTRAVASVMGPICGTPIGVLSFDAVRNAEAGAFDLLVVDEVSKMTLPEFLAVAVKARRWVLVGDPEQLPPYNNAEENGATLDDVIPPDLELVCSIGAVLERVKPGMRREARLVVVARDPETVARAARAHVAAVGLDEVPPIATLDRSDGRGIVVCAPGEVDRACALASPVRGRDRTFLPGQPGSVGLLVERGVSVPRPSFASGVRFLEPRLRAQPLLFENAFAVYHAQPWANRAEQKLAVVRFRKGLDKLLPSEAAIAALGGGAEIDVDAANVRRRVTMARLAARYALGAVSVYDWLTGAPVEDFDTEPLRDLEGVFAPLAGLRAAVGPYVGTLRKQYRMHPSLSAVPRALFYFGEALEDGAPGKGGGCRAMLLQVDGDGPGGETNAREAERIRELLVQLGASDAARKSPPSVLVITPYRKQERLLAEVLDAAARDGALGAVTVEVCTLDRCQGREADWVVVSLVRGRATPFLDAPKRWNVALTRAKEGLVLVGDIEAYLREAQDARRKVRERPDFDRPLMSLLARILEAYDQLLVSYRTPTKRRA